MKRSFISEPVTEPAASRPSPPASPPPLLPPKTRKLQQLAGAAGPGQSGPGWPAVEPGGSQSGHGIATPEQQAAPLKNNNTITTVGNSSGGGANNRGERSSKVTISSDFSGSSGGGLGRSISSVGYNGGGGGQVVRKPVRRSKSQLQSSKYVANIQHGGLVTLVSLRDDLIK